MCFGDLKVRFLGMEFNPVVLFVSVSCVLGVVVTAVADSDGFFTRAASAKRYACF